MLLAATGGCWLSASAHAQMLATSAHGEVAVIWTTAGDDSQRTTWASTGTPGGAFTAPQRISPPSPHTTRTSVAMDAAGNAVVVWEDSFCTGGYKGNCGGYRSLGVWASVRPAGGRFRPPLRLSPEQEGEARPLLAMNRSGDWIVVMQQGAGTALATARGAGSITSSGLGRPGLIVYAVALDAAGNATLAGTTTDREPAAIVRSADGTMGELAILDTAQLYGAGPSLGAGPQGHAVVMWGAGSQLRFATRQPGGRFGPAMASGMPATLVLGPIGVDDRGRTITLLPHTLPEIGMRLQLHVARGTVDAPFGELAIVSDPARDAPATTAHAFSGDGDAALLWNESDRGNNPATRLALATDGGAFSAPRPLTTAAGEALESAGLAFDDGGRLVLAWTSPGADRQRVFAAAVSPTAGIAGPTLVAEVPLINPQPRASAQRGQILRIRTDGTVRPLLRCAAPNGTKCRGSARIDVRAASGRRVRAGTASFVHRADSSQRVAIRLTRTTRRAARRRTLMGTITVRTRTRTGGYVTATTALTLHHERR